MNQTAYQIKVHGQLDAGLSAWFDEWAITHTADGNTLLTGTGVDQAALYGVLARCRDLGLTLVSLNPLSANFIQPHSAQSKHKENAMNTVHIEYAEVIDARPSDVYAVLVDYRVEHPAILPRQYFSSVTVEKGGHGAGTVLRTEMNVFGQKSSFHQLVSEPEPGVLLVETDLEKKGQVTSFRLEPINSGKQTRLTIHSEFPTRGGLAGFMERLMQPPVVMRIYKAEMRLLAAHLRHKAHVAAAVGA